VRKWQDLDWTRAADDAQARQDDLLHSKIFTEMEIGMELGQGTSGIAYTCTFPSLSTEPMTVKLPVSLFDIPMLLFITGDHKLHETLDSDNDDAKTEDSNEYSGWASDDSWPRRKDSDSSSDNRKDRAIDNFSDEFDNYEKIYVVPALRNTGLGHVTRTQHAALMQQQFTMEQKAGRAHIHRILHFDASVPALFSEKCDGTLRRYRRSNVGGLFDAQANGPHWDMSAEWLRVAAQVGSAVTYMREMGVAHCDVNINNVFYSLRGGYAHYLVADFGLCHPLALEDDYFDCRTTHYFEPEMWEQPAVDAYGHTVSYNPFTLVVYTFAALMVNCLKLPHVEFPYSLERSDFRKYRCLADEIKHVETKHTAPLFPSRPSPSFCEQYPAWSYIIKILSYDYLMGRRHSTQPLLDALLMAIAAKTTPDPDTPKPLAAQGNPDTEKQFSLMHL